MHRSIRVPALLGRLMIATLCCLAAGGLSPRTGHAATAGAARDSRFGVVEAWRAPEQATALGVGWERIGIWWKELQPNGPASWNPFATGRDHFIDHELAAGRSLAGLLINTPDWAALHPADHGASVPRGLYLPYDDPRNYWGHFVGLIARRYAGRIDDWIIWNEVDIPNGQWHTWDGSVADYARLVEVAYLAAKAANPHARIVLFGDPYWYDHGAFFQSLIKDLTTAPGAARHNAYFDVANLHLYSRPMDLLKIVPLYRRIMARYGLHKPIWIAETNAIPYDDPVRRYPRSGFFASMEDQASYIVEAFALDLVLGIDRIEVNRMVDGTDFAAGGEPFGLIRNDGSVRPAYYAFRTVAVLFSHVTHGSLHIDPATGVYTVTLTRPGATITVTWDQRPTAAAVTIAARDPNAVLFDKLGAIHRVRMEHGCYMVHLDPAAGNTDAADPRDYVIGGSPQILLQAR